jgi:hypothetical protein
MNTLTRIERAMANLRGRIIVDFKLNRFQAESQNNIIQQIATTVATCAFTKAMEYMDSSGEDEVNAVFNKTAGTDAERNAAVTLLIVSKTRNFEKILLKEYTRFKKFIFKKMGDDKNNRIKEADSTEAVSDLLSFIEDNVDSAGADTTPMSVIGAGVDLLFDPMKYQRSIAERQMRFFMHAGTLLGKVIGGVWSGFLIYTICDALEQQGIISIIPPIIKEVMPQWYVGRNIGGQVLLLCVLAIAVGAAIVVISFAWAWAARAKSLTRLFVIQIPESELISTILKESLLPIFPAGVPAEALKSSCDIVYQNIYLAGGRNYRQDFEALENILRSSDERAAVAFLKSKVKQYKKIWVCT